LANDIKIYTNDEYMYTGGDLHNIQYEQI